MYSLKKNTCLIDLKWLKQKVVPKGLIHITAYSGEEPPTYIGKDRMTAM